MPKAYWIACYREIKDPDKVAVYVKVAAPAPALYGLCYLTTAAAMRVADNCSV